MLTPEHIAALRDRVGDITEPIVEFLISDIAERVSEVGQLTGTASYEIWQAQKLGISQKQLKKELQKRLKVSSQQVEQLLTQAAETGYDFDIKRFPTADALAFEENGSLQQILDATIKLAQEDLSNVTQTIGFIAPNGQCMELTDAYQKTCDFAFQKVVNGAQDYNSAVREATRNLAQKGIRTIDYESGVHTSLEAAIRRNIMGGLGLMNEQITQQNHDDLGCDGWEISAHSGSAPDHEPIQGKQYSDKAYAKLNSSLVRRIGTLNCGHSAMPIIMGVNEPQYSNEELEAFRQENEKGVEYNGKHYTLYEASQRQRRLEESIRNRKHRILIDEKLGDKDALQNDQIRLQLLKQEYSRFSKATGLPMQHERMEAAGFDWKKGKAAENAAKESNGAILRTVGQSGSPLVKIDSIQDVSWRKNVGTSKWTDEKIQALFGAEQKSVNRKTEQAVLYGANGEILLQKTGDRGRVRFTHEETLKMRGGVLTHNHPNNSCFSPEDIHTLFNAKLSEIRVVTHDGVYRLQRPSIWPKQKYSLEIIEQIYYDIDKEICSPLYGEAYAGKISFLEAEKIGQIEVIKEFGKRHGLAFEFEAWEDIRRRLGGSVY